MTTRTPEYAERRPTSITCSYTVSEVFQDPDLGLLTGTFSGMVTGFTTPVH